MHNSADVSDLFVRKLHSDIFFVILLAFWSVPEYELYEECKQVYPNEESVGVAKYLTASSGIQIKTWVIKSSPLN